MKAIVDTNIDRSLYLGSSDIAAVLGISPWRSAVDLWLDKVDPQPEDGRNAKAKARGTRLEPYLRDMVESEFGLKIARYNQRYVDINVPYLAAEVDAETYDGDNIELKTASPFARKEWGEEGSDELPLHYNAQVQFALGVTGRQRCRVFALIGDDLKPYVIERDEETIDAMRERCVEFWERFVIPKVRPPLDFEREGVLETLKRLYPGTSGEVLKAEAGHAHWRAVIEAAQAKHKHYKSVYEAGRAHLLDVIGEGTALEFDDGVSFIRKQISKKGYTVDYEPTTYFDVRFGKLKGVPK